MGQLGNHLDLEKSRSELEFIKDIEVEISAAEPGGDQGRHGQIDAACCVPR